MRLLLNRIPTSDTRRTRCCRQTFSWLVLDMAAQSVFAPPHEAKVRLKLVVWGLNEVSLTSGTFGAKFRITVFWSPKSDLSKVPMKNCRSEVWNASRDEATLQLENSDFHEDVPPISLLNAKVFSVEGKAEVHAIQPPAGGPYLMRWTCMYTATLTQSNLFLSQDSRGLVSFPFDSHDVEIQLGVKFGCVPSCLYSPYVALCATEFGCRGASQALQGGGHGPGAGNRPC